MADPAAIPDITISLAGVPAIPHLEQYFGPWAMLEEAFRGVAEHASRIDLVAHVTANQQPEAAAAAAARARPELRKAGDTAIIDITGSLMKRQSSLSSGTSTIAARQLIRQAIDDPEVKSIVLRIDSPGGTVAGTQDLADEVSAAAKKKPVYAYVEDLAASAAYWIGSQATKLFANGTAMVGSIGTYMTVQDYSAVAAKQGIKVHVVRAGEFKGMGAPGTEVTPRQLAELQRVVDETNDQFVAAVAAGRRMPLEKARALADGRIHIGPAAVAAGLIDGVQSFDATLAQLQAESPAGPISNPIAPKRKGSVMSDKPATEVKTEIAAPQPASYQDLVGAFPKADRDFLCEQLAKKATLDEARSAYVAALEAKAETHAAELKKAAAARPGAPAVSTTSRGKTATATIGEETAAGFEGDAVAEMSREVRERMKLNMPRLAAVAAVCRARPELHRAYLEATNPKRVHDKIAQRFEEG